MQTESSDQFLQKIINTLSKKDNVDALLLCGSTATGKQTKSSDHDLVLVVKEKPDKLLSLFTYINGLPADIFFYSSGDIKRIVLNKQIKEGGESWLMHWLQKGKISFDKSGDLSKLQNMISEIQYPLDTSAGTSAYKINYNLVNNTRYFESNDSLYHSALEIRLLYSTVEALVGYFSIRHIYWEGEKKSIQYLENQDPEYLSVFQKTARASNLQDKFAAYRDLVEKSFTSEYPKWDKDVVTSVDGDFGVFWKNLLK
jgi:predicted nucleotidyltransferase